MPLAFDSLSHGRVAFGFFHIESDMLLLERQFFFAGDLCARWRELAAWPAGRDFQARLPGYIIDAPALIGDLHGAIAGLRLEGFLGALYARWPFPRDPAGFRQKAQGLASRQVVEEIMASFGRPVELALSAQPGPGVFALGEVRFDRPGLLALVDYVWRGGMPGWWQGQRPEYLQLTARALTASGSPWFQGLYWDPAALGFAF